MLQWTELPTVQWNLIELFSGQGNVSAAFRHRGRTVASFDKEFGGLQDLILHAKFVYITWLPHEHVGGDSMDMTLAAGFLPGAHQENPYRSIKVFCKL